MGAEQDFADLCRDGMEALSQVPQEEIDAIEELRALVQYIDALDGSDRHDALIEFSRSDWLGHGILMLLEDEIGRISREAWKALTRLLNRPTLAKRWNDARYALGRPSIARLTGVAAHPASGFATAPFRTMLSDSGETVIGGAVGYYRAFDYESVRNWHHIDIEAVILWDPRRNTVEADEHIILPAYYDELVVYSDPRAFFTAWATARCDLLERRKRMPDLVRESPDNELPGALVIGDLAAINWAGLGASKLKAGPGTDRAALSRAVLRSARLPVVEGV
jgi:hypothetical protein